jgi:hypothetical protein
MSLPWHGGRNVEVHHANFLPSENRIARYVNNNINFYKKQYIPKTRHPPTKSSHIKYTKRA